MAFFVPPQPRHPMPDAHDRHPATTPYQQHLATDANQLAARNAQLKFMQGKSPAAVRAQQTYLRKQGFKLDVDGIRGSQTQSAWKAYMTGTLTPQKWNAMQGVKPVTKKGGGAGPRAVAPVGVSGRGSTAGRGSAAGSARTVASATPKLPQFDLGLGDSINPASYAKAAVDAEYGPQIAELSRAQAKLAADAGAADTDIKGWYDQLLKEAGAAATANSDALKGVLSGQDAATQGVISALGGGQAAQEAAAFGSIGRGETAGLGLIGTGFANAMRPVLGLQGAEARTNVARDFTNQRSDLASKMAALQGAKGSAFTQALFEAQDQADRQKLAHINAQAQMAMLPLEVQKAQLGLQAGQQDLARGQLAYNTEQLKYAMGLQDLKNAQTGDDIVPRFGKLNPSQLSSLRDNLLSEVVSQDNPSALAVNPMRVYNAWGNTLRAVSGGKWNAAQLPAVKSWRDNLLRTFLPGWNAAHPNKKYGFKGGKLVYIGSGHK